MATTGVTTSPRIISVVPNPQHPLCALYERHNVVSLGLEVYITRRSGHVFTEDPVPSRPTPLLFPRSSLEEPEAMRVILGGNLSAAGLAIDRGFDPFLDALASTVLQRFLGTGSASLCAKLKVVITDQRDVDDAMAVERLKVDCGFESVGIRELGTCSICLDELSCREKEEKRLIRTPCSHLYHESCIVAWLEKKKKSCPLCRAQLL